MSCFPITFCIPKSKIIKNLPNKTKILSNLIPGKLETYIYGNEDDYYHEYQTSIFAITHKKGGWDCLRHYEILANGCIPLFLDIETCPINTLAFFPKQLIISGNKLYEKLKDHKEITQLINNNQVNCLISELLNYTEKNLTTEKMAYYILKKSNNIHIKSILYLSGDTGPDYLRDLILSGFKNIYGYHCHDYPKITHIYKNQSINYSQLYGKGISYTSLIDKDLHFDEFDKSIENDIKNKKYDIIIYGSYHRGMPFYDTITKIYNPSEVILLCGEDEHVCTYSDWVKKGHFVFVRESN